MQQTNTLFSRLRELITGRARWGVAAVLVVAAPLFVVAAVRQGADLPKPEEKPAAASTEGSSARRNEGQELASGAGGGVSADPETLKTLAAIVAEPQAEETVFDDTAMVAALDAALAADDQQGPGAGPTADITGGASPAPAPQQQPSDSDSKKKKKDKKTSPPSERRDRRASDPLQGAFEGGRDPNMSALESAVEIDENEEEIEREEECEKDSDDPECNPAAVPLPASLPLLASGAAALGFFRRRRRKDP